MKIINPYMILSIVFTILILVLSFVLYIQSSYYEIGGIKIKQSTINDFSNVMNDKPFRLCDTMNQCVMFGRIK
jgi:hypothetical protein